MFYSVFGLYTGLKTYKSESFKLWVLSSFTCLGILLLISNFTSSGSLSHRPKTPRSKIPDLIILLSSALSAARSISSYKEVKQLLAPLNTRYLISDAPLHGADEVITQNFPWRLGGGCTPGWRVINFLVSANLLHLSFDLLSIWLSDQWVSTFCRVSNPSLRSCRHVG